MEEKKYIILRGLEGNEAPQLDNIQQFLLEHIELIKTFYWILFFTTLFTLVHIKIYKENKEKES